MAPRSAAEGRTDPTPPRKRRPIWMALLAAAITFAAVYGTWSRQRADDAAANSPSAPGGLFLATQAEGTSLTGAGRVRGMAEPCTAWLLDTGGAAGDQAFAVTAGRCAGITDGATVVSSAAVDGASLDLNDFARVSTAAELEVVRAPVEEIAWASRRWTDLAVLRLGVTYADLAADGIEPISPVAPPTEGDELLVASVPIEGVPEDQQFLRGSRCVTGRTTDVTEAGLLWHDARATDCQGILAGSQGAPVFNQAGDAVAMVATSTIAAPDGDDCGPGRPCEVRDGGVQPVVPDTTYILPVQGLQRCFADGDLQLGDGCPLEDPATAARARAEALSGQPGSSIAVIVEDGSAAPADGLADVQGLLGSLDCFAADGWSAPVPTADWSLSVTVPPSPGWALACVGSPDQPTPVVVAPTPGS